MRTHKTAQERDYSGLLVKLLQGFVYREEKRYWDQLMLKQDAVRAHFDVLGLYLHLDDTDGYALLRSIPGTSDAEDMPTGEGETENVGDEVHTLRLMRKMPLSFEVSLLCVLIRESLEQYDEKVSDDHRLILTRSDIHDWLREFMADTTDEAKQQRRFDTTINKVVELGFLREFKTDGQRFEVRRSIKALLDARKLVEIRAEMERAVAKGAASADSSGEATLQ